MAGKVRPIRVFVASPGDVQIERDALQGVVNELNRTFYALIPQSGIRVELVRWETDVAPDLGRPQEVINAQIRDYDIFVGIFWKRFGTPTGKAKSGTEEEFEIALKRRTKHGAPRIMIYFNVTPVRPPQSREELDQLTKVFEFRQRFNAIGLAWTYEGDRVFTDAIRPHLVKVIGQLIHKDGGSVTKGRGRTKRLPIPIGEKVTIVEIGPEDACYAQQSKYLGHRGVVIEAEEQDGWLSGTMRFDTPLFRGDNGVYQFLQFRVAPSAN
jgi:hypothetical protein